MTDLKGMAMDMPLLISSILRHAARWHGDVEVVCRDGDGSVVRSNYATVERRAKKLAQALRRNGVMAGTRVATLAWNTIRHMEVFYAVTGMGAVLHTVNTRLSVEQLAFVLNDGGAEVLLFDRDMVAAVLAVAPRLVHVKTFVVMDDDADGASSDAVAVACYETWLAGEDGRFEWPVFDENNASIICYTSGTTGNPKGVVSSHRSILLLTMTMASIGFMPPMRPDRTPVMMPWAPMFHSNAWNYPFIAPYTGCKLVLTGRNLQPDMLYDLIEEERVTNVAGVPSLIGVLLQWLDDNAKRFSRLEVMLSAGSAVAQSVVARFDKDYGVRVYSSWGMTEANAAATGVPNLAGIEHDADAQIALRSKSGRPSPFVDIRIIDADGKALPHDGTTSGLLMVKGPWVAGGYLHREPDSALIDGEWLDTGDIATIDSGGYLQIVDRAKDLIKSGGEWISSVEVEAAAISHPSILQAAVIGIPDPKWEERPLLVAVAKPGADVSAADIQSHLRERLPKWWVPDIVDFVERLPVTGTNKIRKVDLRKQYANFNDRAAPAV